MKKTILSLLAAFTAVSSFAQNSTRIFKPFKFDIAFGTATLSGPTQNIGLSLTLEPKYAVMENLALGFRVEGLVGIHDFTVNDNTIDEDHSDPTTTSSYLATGDYYFSNRAFRPFVGGGLGVYANSSATYKSDEGDYYSYEVPSSTKFGGMIRGGFEVLHFRLGAEYNFVGNTSYTKSYTSGQAKNSCFVLKLGLFIGGGKYKRER